MPASTIQNLLGLPDAVTQPNAYQVFGLTIGESDHGVIAQAVAGRIAKLKAAKSSTPPELWARAAKVVQTAKNVLQDPDQKAILDARFGIVPVELTGPNAVADPLAGLLPPSAPAIAPANPAAAAAAGDRSPALQPPAPQPPAPQPPALQPPSTQPPAMPPPPPVVPSPANVTPVIQPIVRGSSRVRRRRSWAGTILGGMMLLMLMTIVGGMGYFLFYGPGVLQIASSGDGLTIRTGPAAGIPATPSVAPPRPLDQEPTKPRPPRDPVLGPVAPIVKGSSEQSLANSLPIDTMQPMDTMPSMPEMSSMDEMPVMPDTTASPTDAEIRAADEAIAVAVDAIATANWNAMKPLAETATEKAATEAQRERAATIAETADLATYYREGVRRAMAGLIAGNEFEVLPGSQVIVVESSADHLVYRRGAKNTRHEIETIALTLCDALAPLQLPKDSPTVQAARAVYQALSPRGTPGHRDESIEFLASAAGVKGADPTKIAELLRELPPRP